MAPASSEQNFRSNLSQFRWARGATDDSNQQQPLPRANPFSRFYNAIGGDYVPLRSNERSNEDEAWFALSSWERYTYILSPHDWRLIGAHVVFQAGGFHSLLGGRSSVFFCVILDATASCPAVCCYF
jgi:hypothetical protein